MEKTVGKNWVDETVGKNNEIVTLMCDYLLDDNKIKAYSKIIKLERELIIKARLDYLLDLTKEYLNSKRNNIETMCIKDFIIKIDDFESIVKNNISILEFLFLVSII